MKPIHHTPGPWSINAKEIGKGADGSIQHIPVVKAQGGGVIAHVYANCLVTSDEEVRANAHLVAAAPALLDFVEYVLRDLEQGYMTTKPVYRPSSTARRGDTSLTTINLAAVARDLIAQAKGGNV
jgi:hypothetical protein